MKFIVTSSVHGPIVIEAPSHFDASAYAARLYPSEDRPEVERTADHRIPDVELRFVGDDYAHGGGPNRRRMQARQRLIHGHSDWRDL